MAPRIYPGESRNKRRLFKKVTKEKKAKGDLTTTDFAAGNRHVVT